LELWGGKCWQQAIMYPIIKFACLAAGKIVTDRVTGYLNNRLAIRSYEKWYYCVDSAVKQLSYILNCL
jgi:hypothetical protein